MKSVQAKVTSKGQLTLPKALRKSMGIRTGDKIWFKMTSPTEANLSMASVPGSSAGVLSHLAKSKAPSITDMKKAVSRRVVEKYSR